MDKIIVTGIGTGVGKTVVSAVLLEALHADYWKPIQTHDHFPTDTEVLRGLVSNPHTRFHPESYRLPYPVSPHHAARCSGIEIEMEKIQCPEVTRPLVIEGLGGLLVPLNKEHLLIDLFAQWNYGIVLVSQHYVGSINHTLLSIEACKSRGLPLVGIVFNGEDQQGCEEIILNMAGVPCLGRMKEEKESDKNIIRSYASQWQLQQLLTAQV